MKNKLFILMLLMMMTTIPTYAQYDTLRVSSSSRGYINITILDENKETYFINDTLWTEDDNEELAIDTILSYSYQKPKMYTIECHKDTILFIDSKSLIFVTAFPYYCNQFSYFCVNNEYSYDESLLLNNYEKHYFCIKSSFRETTY